MYGQQLPASKRNEVVLSVAAGVIVVTVLGGESDGLYGPAEYEQDVDPTGSGNSRVMTDPSHALSFFPPAAAVDEEHGPKLVLCYIPIDMSSGQL